MAGSGASAEVAGPFLREGELLPNIAKRSKPLEYGGRAYHIDEKVAGGFFVWKVGSQEDPGWWLVPPGAFATKLIAMAFPKPKVRKLHKISKFTINHPFRCKNDSEGKRFARYYEKETHRPKRRKPRQQRKVIW